MARVATESPQRMVTVTDCAPSIETHGTGYLRLSELAHSEVSLKRTTACRQEPSSNFSPDGRQNRM
jgi:hypothetical protein